MKKVFLIPLIMTVLTLPVVGEETSKKSLETSQVEMVISPKLVDRIMEGYKEGKYRSFLNQMHSQHEEASKKWEYNGVLEDRKKLSTLVQDFNAPAAEELKNNVNKLHEEQNRELVDLCLKEADSELSREIKEMVFFTPSKEQQASLDYLASLATKFKGDGKTPVENKLISIDTEFWLKMLSLDILLTQKKIDADTYKEQRLVLQMEKLNQMKEACQEPDVDLQVKNAIETAYEVYPKVQAVSWTRQHLNHLATGKISPQNETEQKIKDIVVKYNEKENALISKHFAEDQK